MLSLWCSKKEFMTAPSCRAAAGIVGYLCPSNMAPPLISCVFPIPSPALRLKGYQGRSPWLVSALRRWNGPPLRLRHARAWLGACLGPPSSFVHLGRLPPHFVSPDLIFSRLAFGDHDNVLARSSTWSRCRPPRSPTPARADQMPSREAP